MDFKKYLKLLVIIPILLAIYINFWVLHSNYNFPVHVDEWQHIAQAKQLIQNQFFSNENPYIAGATLNQLPSVGFHYLLATLGILFNFDLVYLLIYLKIFFSILMVLGAYLLGKEITKNEMGGFFFSLTITLLKSDITILGPAFMVPISLLMDLLPTFLYFFIKSFETISKYTFLFFFLAIFLITIHTPFISFLLILFSVYLLFVIFTKSKSGLITLCVLSIPAITGYLLLSPMFLRDPTNLERLISILRFAEHNEGGGIVIIYDAFYLLGVLGVVSLLVGVMNSLKNKFVMFLLSIFTIFLALIIIYSQFEYTYLMPYRRLLMYLSSFGLLVGGYGLFEIYSRLSKEKMIKIAFVILALIFAFTQINGSVKKTTQVYHFFNPADYAAMDFLKNNTLNSTILALPQVSTALTPITGNKVCTITRAQLSGGLNPENVRDAITNGDCKKINDLMVECKTKYVVSKSELNCDFLNRIESLNLYQHKNDLLK